MTPYEIEILLHFNVSRADFIRSDAPLYQPTVDAMVADDLLTLKEWGYSTTERGVAHIRQLCSTPFPVQRWVNKEGRIIK